MLRTLVDANSIGRWASIKTITADRKQVTLPHPFNAATIPSLYDVALNWKARSTLLLSKR